MIVQRKREPHLMPLSYRFCINAVTISEEGNEVVVKAKNVKAVVAKATGEVTFFDANGKQLLKEAKDGKKFWDFTVPERELGIKTGYTVPEAQKHGLSWQMKFDSPDDEAFYGLGQHQSEEFNMKGKNEDLFQYNTKVSIPFVLSNKKIGRASCRERVSVGV